MSIFKGIIMGSKWKIFITFNKYWLYIINDRVKELEKIKVCCISEVKHNNFLTDRQIYMIKKNIWLLNEIGKEMYKSDSISSDYTERTNTQDVFKKYTMSLWYIAEEIFELVDATCSYNKAGVPRYIRNFTKEFFEKIVARVVSEILRPYLEYILEEYEIAMLISRESFYDVLGPCAKAFLITKSPKELTEKFSRKTVKNYKNYLKEKNLHFELH